MKPHIVVTLRSRSDAAIPHWADVVSGGARAAETLRPEIDTLLQRYRTPAMVTREYRPAGSDWSREEIACGLDRVYRLVLERTSTIPPDLVRDISLLPTIDAVRIGQIASATLPSSQLAAGRTRPRDRARASIYLDEAHELTMGDRSITVAVLDTGMCQQHPELAHAMQTGRDFVDIIDGAGAFVGDFLGADEDPEDEVGHGTHVAGIIAGKGQAMPPGVAPRCRILPVRVLGAMSRGDEKVGAGLVDNINNGVKWAIDNGADVINMSLGIRHERGGLPHEDVVRYAQQKGVTIVAASGNDGAEELYYPGGFPYVITVGACDEEGRVAPYSTYGRQVDFTAPGTDIYSSFLENDYAFSTGTSHAAPFVAGAVALLKSHARRGGARLSDAQVKHLLQQTADRVDTRLKNRRAGFGKLNLIDALRLLEHKLN